MHCNLRDWVIFFAGAEFFHTVNHIIMPYFVIFPVDMKVVVFTTGMNLWAIVINGVILLLLLWWAKRINCDTTCKK